MRFLCTFILLRFGIISIFSCRVFWTTLFAGFEKRILYISRGPEKYDITKIYDHNEQYVFRCLGYKALCPDAVLPDELAEKGLNLLKADPIMLGVCQSQLERIKNIFPLEEVPEKPKRKAFRK